jgi:hypothetical protein
MNVPSPQDEQLSQTTRQQNLKRAVKWAAGIHLAILIISYFGLPHFRDKNVDLSTAVQVDLVTPKDAFSRAPNTSKSQAKFKQDAKADQKNKDVKSDAKKPPSPVKSDAAKKDLTKKPDEKKMEKPKEKKEAPKKEAIKKADDKKKQDKKDTAKPTRDDGAATEEEQQEFNSVLKNLLAEETPKVEESGNPIDAPYNPDQPEGVAPTSSDTLAISEIDALKYQLARCWNVPAGAMNAQDLIIDIRITVNPDRTVQAAEIVDRSRYNTDTFFAAAAESARRALFHPTCTPLELPADKYVLWHEMTIRFNPRDMF